MLRYYRYLNAIETRFPIGKEKSQAQVRGPLGRELKGRGHRVTRGTAVMSGMHGHTVIDQMSVGLGWL